MSYLTRKFAWVQDDQYGNHGWTPIQHRRSDIINAGFGLGVAHDTLEHFTMAATVEEELLAFGSIWYCRAEVGRINENGQSRYTEAQVMAMDLVSLFGLAGFRLPKPVRLGYSPHTEYLRDRREEMLLHFLKDLDGELEASDHEEMAVADRHLMFARAFGWMHKGYCMARKRWHGDNQRGGQAAVSDVFWGIVNDVDRYHKTDAEGDILTVHVNCLRYGYTIKQSWEHPDYY